MSNRSGRVAEAPDPVTRCDVKASDVMSSPAITVPTAAPVPAVAALLASHGFTAAPVLDDGGHLVGIVTEADLVRDRIRPEGWPAAPARGVTVAEVMTGTPLAMRPEDDLADVVSLMLDGHVRSVPIVDDGRVVGVLSRRDVLRVVARGELSSEEVRERRGPAAEYRPAAPPPRHRAGGAVVVGVDGSAASRAALRYAAGEAVSRGAWLTVVAAVNPDAGGPGDGPPLPTPDGLLREVDREIRAVVADELSRHVPGAVGATKIRVRAGGPAQVLLDEARDAELLVLGRRDRNAGLGLLAGSVAVQCAHHASCSVTVVPEPSSHPAPDDVGAREPGTPAVPAGSS